MHIGKYAYPRCLSPRLWQSMYGHYITNYMVLILCFLEGIWLHMVIYIINIYINNIYDVIIGNLFRFYFM